MPGWAIALIVISIVLFIILPSVLFTYAGLRTVKMLNRNKSFSATKMDISFFKDGPLKPLIQEGLNYIETLTYEDIYIKSYDGLKLHGYLFKNPSEKTNKYFLGIHGFKSEARSEYAPYIKKIFELGFNVILPDQRAHGLSEGKYLTMGVKERFDVLSWCEYITSIDKTSKILIEGISMGAASVCLASDLNLPNNVIGIISDCGYTSFKDEINHTMITNFKVPTTFPLVNIIGIYTKIFAGLDFKSESPLEAVKKAKVPMLFIHGEKDAFVPSKFATQLYDNCGNRKDIYLVKDANHAESGSIDMNKYFEKIKEFFKL